MKAAQVDTSDPSPDLWVFGYGSLIWRPDFPFVEQRRARLAGFHRALCAYSVAHRGTVDWPGLIFALRRGGYCDGVAFRVAARDEDRVVTALRAREQVTGVYQERRRPVRLGQRIAANEQDRLSDVGAAAFDRLSTATDGQFVRALFYIVDATHRQFAGNLDIRAQIRIVRGALGGSGANIDYVLETHRALTALGIRDRQLARLAAAISPARTSDGTPRLGPVTRPVTSSPATAVGGKLIAMLPARLARGALSGGRHPVRGWRVRSSHDLAIHHRRNLGT
ncbi:MAG: gamma-glutamylcyclotransferase [Pseudomonadota bacterium]